jgi:glycosyltransferase involved in cell wall biosynthesis
MLATGGDDVVAQRVLRVLSVYEGFFSGGARALHTTVVAGLHTGGGQSHAVLSIHHTMHRESTFQRMADDPRYRSLRAAGVPITSLGRGHDHPGDGRSFSPAEIAVATREAERADLVLSLKEQPLRLVNHPGFPPSPTVVCLHRSDPENSGRALDDLRLGIASGRVVAAICCAESTRDAYRAAGVPGDLLRVIPNGVDLARFLPVHHAERSALRAGLGVPDDAAVVVFAARYDGMKNVPLFVRAARQLLASDPGAHVVACGAGMTAANVELLGDLDEVFAGHEHLRPRLHLLGVRHDMPGVYAAADVVALTSAFGEAAPLCLMEGAACGAVPVATDVGDCARIVDGIGLVADADPEALAAAWSEAARRRPTLQPALRASRERFSHTRMISAYAAALDEVREAVRADERIVSIPARRVPR